MDDISDLDIQALVDGELDELRAGEIRDAISKHPVKLKRFEELQKQKEQLREWWSQFKQEH